MSYSYNMDLSEYNFFSVAWAKISSSVYLPNTTYCPMQTSHFGEKLKLKVKTFTIYLPSSFFFVWDSISIASSTSCEIISSGIIPVLPSKWESCWVVIQLTFIGNYKKVFYLILTFDWSIDLLNKKVKFAFYFT